MHGSMHGSMLRGICSVGLGSEQCVSIKAVEGMDLFRSFAFILRVLCAKVLV